MTAGPGARPMSAPGQPGRWPVVGVSVAVFRGPDVLIVRRGRPPFLDHWSLPGGRVEEGEALEEAVRRELLEETGIDADLVGLNDLVQPIGRDKAGRVTSHYVIISFVARYLSGRARAGDDAADLAWIAPDTIARYRTTPGLPRLLARARRIADAERTEPAESGPLDLGPN